MTRGADGKVETVNYLTLTSMLLNEFQKQREQISKLNAKVELLTARRSEPTWHLAIRGSVEPGSKTRVHFGVGLLDAGRIPLSITPFG